MSPIDLDPLKSQRKQKFRLNKFQISSKLFSFNTFFSWCSFIIYIIKPFFLKFDPRSNLPYR
jgi:hypothetical protein